MANPGIAYRLVRKAKTIAKRYLSPVLRWVSKGGTVAQGKAKAPGEWIASWKVVHFEAIPRVSGSAQWAVEIENTGRVGWSARDKRVLAIRWLLPEAADRFTPLSETVLSELPELSPGQKQVISGEIPVPINSVFDLVIEINVRDAGGKWLATPAESARFPRHVGGQDAQGAPLDFDYEKLYANLDLEKDYWTIVGPGTREEYEKLGAGKCRQMLDLGMTPTSRVLDVGCGTGQLAEPLVKHLVPGGLYYGTDLAGPAIEFCKKKFPYPNFHFIKNDQSVIPIKGIEFDFIYLGSVFTHMYPEDIRGMLVDLRRLMAPTGMVIVDAFVSPEIPDFIGSRAMIQLNEAKLHQNFRDRGFQHRELMSIPWNDHCRRVVFLLSAAEAGAKAA